MSKSNVFENSLLLLIFNATNFANLADNDASSPATNLYVSLHTADPGEAGDQSTNETSYGSYARVAVVRTSSGWTVTANAVTNVAAVLFPTCTSGTPTITHFGIGVAISGAGQLLYSNALTTPLAVSTGIAPEFAIGEIDVTED